VAHPKTLIRGSYIIAFDGERHRYLRDGELVYQDREIIFVGKKYNGHVEKTLNARGKIVCPGLISTHAHLNESPLDRSFIEDRGNPQFYYSGLYDYLPARKRAMDREMMKACFGYSLAELLRSGITTVVEICSEAEDLLPLVPVFGNRVYICQSYRSGQWYTPDGKKVLYEWFKDKGWEAFENTLKFIQEHNDTCEGLINGCLCPRQVDVCTESLLVKTQEWANKLKVPVTLHVSQSVIEFNEMLQRHGKTPLKWLHDIGFLQENVILGHAIIIGGTSWANYPPGDLEIMAKTRCTVSHSPWVFGRRGIVMESFYKYQQAGINMSLGTDTSSQSMIQAMRWAAILSKVVERNTESTTAADVFNAATLGGAKALGRNDLGRLCAGAKADIVIFSGESMNMTPLRDAVKNIVYSAESEDIETVIINGKVVLENGKTIGKDGAELYRELQRAGERMWPKIKGENGSHHSIDDLSPMSFAPWEE
jgi:5-methylthioadenosine/S-adenosylhomocysteine deaminase